MNEYTFPEWAVETDTQARRDLFVSCAADFVSVYRAGFVIDSRDKNFFKLFLPEGRVLVSQMTHEFLHNATHEEILAFIRQGLQKAGLSGNTATEEYPE